jgi:hypothetical protein
MTAAQQQKPDKSLRELAQFAFDQAARIEAVQGALIEQGFCAAPDAAQMVMASDFNALGKLTDFVRSDELMIRRLRELAIGARRAEAAAAARAAAEKEKEAVQ